MLPSSQIYQILDEGLIVVGLWYKQMEKGQAYRRRQFFLLNE